MSKRNKIQFREELREQALFIGMITPWNAWMDFDKCKICGQGYVCLTFEFTIWRFGHPTHISEACSRCTRHLVQQDKEYTSQEFWQRMPDAKAQFESFGLLEPVLTSSEVN